MKAKKRMALARVFDLADLLSGKGREKERGVLAKENEKSWKVREF